LAQNPDTPASPPADAPDPHAPGAEGETLSSPPPFRLDAVSVPRIHLDVKSRQVLPGQFLRAVYPKDRVWVHVALLLATLLTTTLVGMNHWYSYQTMMGRARPGMIGWGLLWGGLWYSLPLLAILGSHEMGHYLACVRYKVNASLPFFLPVPPPFIAGTMGAFIKIRAPIRTKRQLFDIGIAGPLAGFIVAVPVLFAGLALSTKVPIPRGLEAQEFADPLLFKLANWLVVGPIKDGLILNAHPMVFAAWFGCLATALNLFPIGQLDGGHISYAVLGRRSTGVTFVALGVTLVMAFFSVSWIAWAVLMVVMLYAFGPRHPRTIDEDEPLDRGRVALAVVAAVILALCFMPSPINQVVLGR
jgi:hypothetical protein